MGIEEKLIAIIGKSGLVDSHALLAQSFGYKVVKMYVGKKTTPEEVASFVKKQCPDLVLLDENYLAIKDVSVMEFTKRGEGVKALEKIRETDKKTPIFMVSSYPRYQREAIEKDATGYYEPSEPEEFEQFLNSKLQS